MKNIVIRLYKLLSPQERRSAYKLLLMILVMGMFDMAGVASILPVMAVLTNPEVVQSNVYLSNVYQSLGFSDTKAFLLFLGIAFFLVFVCSIIFKILTTYALMRFTNMRNYSLSRRMVADYLRQTYDWFLNRHSSDLGKTVLSEVNEVIQGALIPLMQLISYGVVAISLFILLMIVDPQLTVIVAACLGGAYALIYLFMRRYLKKLGEIQVEVNRQRFHVVQEVFGAIKDVKVSGLESTSLHRFEVPAKKFSHGAAMLQIATIVPRYILELVAFGGMLLVVVYVMSVSSALQEALPIMSVYALAGYKLLPALQQVYAQVTRMRFAGHALEVLYSDMSRLKSADTIDLSSGYEKPMGLASAIKLENISYTYPGAERMALSELSLEIQSHTSVGLVGTTGSGKTTTVDLILGLLRPQEGNLIVDGVIISAENMRTWQRTIGYVSQNISLVDDSVVANIAFGVPEDKVDRIAVERAAKIANLHNFVIQDMPNGYETLVGEQGVRLSGGQRQRIGIARALYHDPAVLILDEATSALDNLTEQAVMEAVTNLGRRKTIIIIAHRLSTVRDCDNIFLLEHGQLIASGTYDELEAGNRQFQSMVGLTN